MASSVFKGIKFYIIDIEDTGIVDCLKEQGASKHPILSDTVKFAVSDKGKDSEVGEAEDLYAVPVVTSQWVRYSVAKNVFLPFAPFHPNFNKIFNGVSVVISEISLKDTVTLTANITIRGGKCKNMVDKETTHLILGRASGPLYERCKTQFPNIRLVSPDWVVECVKAQELVDWEKYHVDLLVKPPPPKPPIMPKPPLPTTVQLVEQPSQKQLAQQLGAVGTSIEYYHIPPEAVRHVFGIQPGVDGTPRIISTNAGLIGFTSSGLPVVSQPQASAAAAFHQQIQHASHTQTQKSTGKGKANKQPNEQGLNEQQMEEIVKENVKNILRLQPNWNKDNSQNRSGQMPGAFLPAGSNPIATGGSQRKPKSPKSPANRGSGQAGGSSSGSSAKANASGQKLSKGGGLKRGELAEIAVAPQQQHFTTVTLDAAGNATQLFPQTSAGATVVVAAAANPGVASIAVGQQMTVTSPQNGATAQAPAFLLQQQQHQQFQQQQALLAAAPRTTQVQVSPLLLQSAQAASGHARTATFIVRAPSAPDIQLSQGVAATDSVQTLLDGVAANKESMASAPAQQVILQPGYSTQQQQLIQLQQQQQQKSDQPTPSHGGAGCGQGGGGVLSPVFIQGRQPQPQQQYKQSPGQLQVPVAGLQQQNIRPQPQRPNQGMRQALPPNHHAQAPQQQYTQLASQSVKSGLQHPQLGQQIIIQTSGGMQQVVTAQDLGGAQYIGASGAQMRTVANSAQCASPRPTGIVGSPTYTQGQQVIAGNGSIMYHGTHQPSDSSNAAGGNQQDRIAYMASVQQQQQHNQTQVVGGRLQPAILRGGQQIQPQPSSVLSARSVTGAGGQNSVMQQQQPGLTVQSGQFYTQGHLQQQQQQQQQRILLQQQQQPQLGVGQQPQHCLVQQGQLQGQMTHGGGGTGGASFIQQQQQQRHQQLLAQGQTHQVLTGQHPHLMQAAQQQQLMAGPRGPMNAQMRHMMPPQPPLMQQQPSRPMGPPPQYRSALPPRPPTPTNYSSSMMRAQQHVMPPVHQSQPHHQPPPQHSQQPNVNVSAAVPCPAVFQLPTFHGHVGNACPTAPQDCLIGCVMLIVGYRSFGEEAIATWKKVIRSYGGEVLEKYDPVRVTHIIMDWILVDPDLYYQALRDRKRLVTAYWLNDVLAKGALEPPYEIIHLPSTFSPGVSFSFIRGLTISITGFEGEERAKAEVLIKQIGATFTEHLDDMNSFLVCKYPRGQKYEMAAVWGIHCVNMRWLQDLYLGELAALGVELSHKYRCFDKSDVSIALEIRTPRVQELMVGWQQGIPVTHESWERLAQLRAKLQQEEAEEKLAESKRRQDNKNAKEEEEEEEKKCFLPELSEHEMERARSGKLRDAMLREEAERVASHRAALLAAQQVNNAAMLNNNNSDGCSSSTMSSYPPLYPAPSTPQYRHACPADTQLMQQNHKFPTSAPSTATTFPQNPLASSVPPPKQSPPPLVPSQQAPQKQQIQQPASVQTKQELADESQPEFSNALKRPLSSSAEALASSQPPLKRSMGEVIEEPKSVPPPNETVEQTPVPRPASVGAAVTEQLSTKVEEFSAPVAAEPLKTVVEAPKPAPLQTQPQKTTLAGRPGVNPAEQAPRPATVAIDREVRVAFTGVDTELRLAVLQLLAQIPKAGSGVAAFRLVESVEHATCVITQRITRTPKVYMAVALGCPIVSPKWVQASLLRGDWLAETEWLVEDHEAEENLGFTLAASLSMSRERRLLGQPGLFSELEFWFSPQAHHRAVCERLVAACGGRLRERRPTQKMALLPIPRQVIICHEEDSNVASYLMRTKTGNRAVHHEEFILSGVLRQQLDFESYQIQQVSLQFAELQKAISVASSGLQPQLPPPPPPPPPPRSAQLAPVSQIDLTLSTPTPVCMRPPLPPPPPPPPPLVVQQTPPAVQPQQQQPCVLLVSGAESQAMYYIPSGGTVATRSPVASTPAPPSAAPAFSGAEEDLNAARVAAADAHVVASATAALSTTAVGGVGVGDNAALVANAGQQQQVVVNCAPQQQQVTASHLVPSVPQVQPQQHAHMFQPTPPPPPASSSSSGLVGLLFCCMPLLPFHNTSGSKWGRYGDLGFVTLVSEGLGSCYPIYIDLLRFMRNLKKL